MYSMDFSSVLGGLQLAEYSIVHHKMPFFYILLQRPHDIYTPQNIWEFYCRQKTGTENTIPVILENMTLGGILYINFKGYP